MPRTTATSNLRSQPHGPQAFTLPYGFLARSYEEEVFKAYEQGCKRFVLRWHRRSGKDRTCLALTTVAMADRPGLYMHVFPTIERGRDALWHAVHPGGKFLDAFPIPWLDGEPNKTEMLIRVKALPGQPTGSLWKLTGAEDPDRLRGLNPVGVVLSEYSEHNPRVWDEIVSPILNENGGWVIFNFTPQGRNHCYALEQMAKQNPSEWFVSVKTVDDTRRDAPGEDGTWVVPPERIAQDRREGRAEEIVQQESYCSYDGYLLGTIYGDCLRKLRQDGRLTRVPREVTFPVGCCLDIGRTDGTAIWFYQTLAREIRLIDYVAFRATKIGDMSAAHYAIKRIREKPYIVSRIVLPNDAQIKGYSASQSTLDVFREVFPDTILLDKIPVQQGTEMLRGYFSKIVMDEVACLREQEDKLPSGLESLENYRRAWNEDKKDFSGEPIHDQYSHGADALRYGAMEGFLPLEWPGKQIGETHVQVTYRPLVGVRPRLVRV